MALTIRVLGMGQLTSATEADLSTAAVPTGKAQIVKAMRFTNTSTSASIGVSVYLSHDGAERLVSRKNVTIPPGGA